MAYLSGINALLGIWVVISPWIFGYSGNTGGAVSAVIGGLVILVFGGIRFFAGTADPRRASAS